VDAASVETPTGALFAVACTRAGLVGVLFAMQASVYPAEAIASGLRTCHLSERASARYERVVRQRYRNVRRYAIGFYDPGFRELWFTRQNKLRFLAL